MPESLVTLTAREGEGSREKQVSPRSERKFDPNSVPTLKLDLADKVRLDHADLGCGRGRARSGARNVRALLGRRALAVTVDCLGLGGRRGNSAVGCKQGAWGALERGMGAKKERSVDA